MRRSDFLIDRAVSQSQAIRRRMGSVKAVGDTGSVTVLIDQVPGGESTITASNISGYLLIGDRVWVDFVPPKGAVIIGRVPSDPLILGDGHQYNTGWGQGNAIYGPVTINRLPSGEVSMSGSATRSSGSESAIFRMPERYSPKYNVRIPAWTATSMDVVVIQTNGSVSWAGSNPTDVDMSAVWKPSGGE